MNVLAMFGNTPLFGDTLTRSNPYNAGIDFSRQNLILTTKVCPRDVRVKIFLMALGP